MIEGTGTIGVEFSGSGIALSDNSRPPALFKIVSGTNPYTATPVHLKESDASRPDAGTTNVTAAMKLLHEVNAVSTVKADTIVEATPNPHGTGWYFTDPAGGKAKKKYALSPACLAFGPNGGFTGSYQIWYDPNTGEAECVFTPPCEDCESEGTETPGVGGAPPSGTGIVTVNGGAWGTPGPLTGDVTTTGAGLATTIANDAVTYAKIQNVAEKRVLGRNSSGSGDVEEVTFTQFIDWVGSAANGDVLVRAAGSWTRLPIGASGYALSSNGTAVSWAPVAVPDGDKGDITITAGVWTIDDEAVSDAKLRHSAGLSVIGRSANSTGDPADIVGATVGHVLRVSTGPVLGFGYPGLENGSDAGTDTTLSATSGTYTTITGWTFTSPSTGTYLVVASCMAVLMTTGTQPYIVVRMKVNGAVTDTLPAFYGYLADNVYQIGHSRSWILSLTAGDVITFDAAIFYTGTSTYREITVPLLSYVRVA